MSRVICPDCVSYEHCMQMGWADAEQCKNFEHKVQYEIGVINESNVDFAVGKIDTRDLMSNTLQIDRCERIIFRDKTLDFIFELPEPYYKNIDTIIVNGIKFKKVED